MNKREQKIIEERGERWGEWKDRSVDMLGHPKKSPMARMQELGIKIDSQYYDRLAPEYSYESYCKRTDIIIHSMPIEYKDIAYYQWCGVHDPHKQKSQELNMIIRRHGLGRQKNNKWVPDLNKFYKIRKEMLFYIYVSIRVGTASHISNE